CSRSRPGRRAPRSWRGCATWARWRGASTCRTRSSCAPSTARAGAPATSASTRTRCWSTSPPCATRRRRTAAAWRSSHGRGTSTRRWWGRSPDVVRTPSMLEDWRIRSLRCECHEGMAVLAVGGGGLLERHTRGCYAKERSKEAVMEVYVGLDLSRKRLDWQAVDEQRRRLGEGAITPD